MITSHFAIGVDLLQVIAEAKGRRLAVRATGSTMHGHDRPDFELPDAPDRRRRNGARPRRASPRSSPQAYTEGNRKWRHAAAGAAQIAQGVGYADAAAATS